MTAKNKYEKNMGEFFEPDQSKNSFTVTNKNLLPAPADNFFISPSPALSSDMLCS